MSIQLLVLYEQPSRAYLRHGQSLQCWQWLIYNMLICCEAGPISGWGTTLSGARGGGCPAEYSHIIAAEKYNEPTSGELEFIRTK